MDAREKLDEFAELIGMNRNHLIGWSIAADFAQWYVEELNNCIASLPLVEVDPEILQMCIDGYNNGEKIEAIETLIAEVKKVYVFGIKEAKEWLDANAGKLNSSVPDVSGSFLCDGCNVREPWEHRCHGGNCTCDNPVCMERQGRITHDELMEIVNKELSVGK